ncbi:delta-12 fatty acid desaturase [Dendrothele bispora CBS 962.96]|uniref:Delta-12 fatty acid desaturase n=1 Tax=Dendrothele bispora (strain CBS 962.96) TaxID=1314807 RepID=A0A4S8L7V5_DENBC|nr:delta-12 fatty acid desaturase [Dendrothele bispora CBS 962.96]
MFSLKIFQDGPEFEARKNKPFSPSKVTIFQVRAAVPKELFEKNTFKGLLYVARDIICAVALYKLGWFIEPTARFAIDNFGSTFGAIAKWSMWSAYWYCQSVVLAGWWCMAHEAGHGNVSSYNWVNHLIGFCLHTFVLAPYFAWKASHHAHHKAVVSIERDENYVPRTRSDFGLPKASVARSIDYHEILEETPIYTLSRILIMQVIGWQIYLFTDVSGSPRHPKGTNHFSPWSSLFKPSQRKGIIASDIGILCMMYILYLWTQHVGLDMFIKLYFVPYIFLNHWIVMLTYLHHSDPTIPMYRNSQWSFLRGALSTVDRPLLGWAGRVFFHNVSHDHISHHLFSSIPFYNQPRATASIKSVLGEDYNYDSTNSFRALYRSFTQCIFVEDEGDIVFYKDKKGRAQRELAEDAFERPTKMVGKVEKEE